MTRFAVYDVGKKSLTRNGRDMPFYEKVLLAGSAGAMGGWVGTPADMVNVRWDASFLLESIALHNSGDIESVSNWTFCEYLLYEKF